MKVILIIFLCFFALTTWGLPKDLYEVQLNRQQLYADPSWSNFQKLMRENKANEQIEGMAYMVSGGIAFVGGIVGYHNSKDVFAKGAYALSQSLGVAAVGYGAHQQRLGHEQHLLYQTLEADRQLSNPQKDQFVKIYFDFDKQRSQESQRIAGLTHGLLAGLNFYNGSMAQEEDLRSALYFIAAINLLASVSYSF